MTRADRLRARRAQANSTPPAENHANHNPQPAPRVVSRGAQSYRTPNSYVRRQYAAAPPLRQTRKRFELPFSLDDLDLSELPLKRLALFSILPLTILAVALIIFLPHERPRRASGAVAAQPTPTPDPMAQALEVAGNRQASGRTNILVLGSDLRDDDTGFRTDTIMLVSIDADNNKIGVVSFPRDLYVEVPALYPMKINMVMGFGGFDAMQGLFEENFGVHLDHYVMTNFQGFVEIVDGLGGVDVEVTQELTDSCDLPQAVDGDCTVTPGTVAMDGPTALWYIRSRETSSDYDRLRRAQEVGYAAFKKLINLNAITRLPELYSSYSKSMETDMRVTDMIPLMPLAARAFKDRSLINTAAIGENEASPSWTWDGMWILMPDNDAIQQVMQGVGVQ